MSTLNVYKETALPGILQPNSIYFITPVGYPDHVEVVVTNTGATAPHRRVINREDVQGMINTSLASVNELQIVADIAARDAIVSAVARYVYVQNATGDATVQSGGATYMYNPGNTSWIKISESESMDVVLNWSSIVGRPTSSAAQIDTAVSNAHTHGNKTQLDLIGQNGNGELTYNGVQVKTAWSSTGW